MGYAGSMQSWSNSQLGSNYVVLLGCEFAGNSIQRRQRFSGSDVFVVTDPAALIVRFFFLMPAGTQMPAANQITPTMTNLFAALRSRSL
jgi:hypothetical protein